MGYHHLQRPDQMTRALAHFLKPGGALLVVDLVSREEGNNTPLISEQFRNFVPHIHGFCEENVRAMFDNAGLRGFMWNTAFRGQIPRHGRFADAHEAQRGVNFFIAKGSK